MVHFWVNFVDGSSIIENVTAMHIEKKLEINADDPANAPVAMVDAIQEWRQGQAIDTVSCISLSGPVGQPEKVVDVLLN